MTSGQSDPHFYFLPPLLRPPKETGHFAPGLLPYLRVEVCEWSGTECAAIVSTLTAQTRKGERLRILGSDSGVVDEEDDEIDGELSVEGDHNDDKPDSKVLYRVNWHTDRYPLNPDKAYRIRVAAGKWEFGHIDVDVVAKEKQLRTVDRSKSVGVVNGTTVPIKFRIDETPPVLYRDLVALLTTDSLANPFVVAGVDGSRLVPFVSAGAVLDGGILSSTSGGSVGFRTDSRGLPVEAAAQGTVFLFSNWTAETVDVGIVKSDGQTAIFRRVAVPVSLSTPVGLALRAQAFPRSRWLGSASNSRSALPASTKATAEQLSLSAALATCVVSGNALIFAAVAGPLAMLAVSAGCATAVVEAQLYLSGQSDSDFARLLNGAGTAVGVLGCAEPAAGFLECLKVSLDIALGFWENTYRQLGFLLAAYIAVLRAALELPTPPSSGSACPVAINPGPGWLPVEAVQRRSNSPLPGIDTTADFQGTLRIYAGEPAHYSSEWNGEWYVPDQILWWNPGVGDQGFFRGVPGEYTEYDSAYIHGAFIHDLLRFMGWRMRLVYDDGSEQTLNDFRVSPSLPAGQKVYACAPR